MGRAGRPCIGRALDTAQHVIVPEVAQYLDLPQQPLAVDRVLERLRDLLDRHLIPRVRVRAGAHQAVRALSDRLLHSKVRGDLETHAADIIALEPVLGQLILLLLHRHLGHLGGAGGTRARRHRGGPASAARPPSQPGTAVHGGVPRRVSKAAGVKSFAVRCLSLPLPSNF